MRKAVNREIFINTRVEWKDGSKIKFYFTSVKGNAEENYIAVLGLKPGCSDDCSCDGFFHRGHCTHLDHFKLVEKLRYALTSQVALPATTKKVLVEATVLTINKTIGKSVIVIGCDAILLEKIFLADNIAGEVVQANGIEVIEARDLAPLNYRNNGFSLLKRSA
jgi:hypothetical protein